MKKEIIEWIKSIIFAVIFVGLINMFFVPTMVYSISMNPTLVEKDLLILKRTENVKYGDIVSFKSDLKITSSDVKKLNIIQRLYVNTNSSKNLIKRVIGVPGDSIKIEDEKVYINGKLMDEPYLGSPTNGTIYIEKLGDNEYFMMGDNRSHSLDSRYPSVGTIKGDKIIGKVLFRILPFNKIGKVN
ncbi:signal peptidase I [Helicovermis profundi]|uniref:Signal peptidase I n=1 Tax=Helicovermis profundi TaxID=3065157 RepID=A0AAU9DZP6_9FIRM|nr:signal peptidase I [Clostridia bacterium S502]